MDLCLVMSSAQVFSKAEPNVFLNFSNVFSGKVIAP